MLQLVGALEVLLVLFELLLRPCKLVQRLEELLVRIEAAPALVHGGRECALDLLDLLSLGHCQFELPLLLVVCLEVLYELILLLLGLRGLSLFLLAGHWLGLPAHELLRCCGQRALGLSTLFCAVIGTQRVELVDVYVDAHSV